MTERLCDNCEKSISTHKGTTAVEYRDKCFCSTTCLVKYVRYKSNPRQ